MSTYEVRQVEINPGTTSAAPAPTHIDRAGYVVLETDNPQAAAEFAVENMGLSHVHTDDAGRTYLAAHGYDPFSLVYTSGTNGKVDRLAYLVEDQPALWAAADVMEAAGAKVKRMPVSDLWRGEPTVEVKAPSGHVIHLTIGVNTGSVPMGFRVTAPEEAPAPISLDHIAPRFTDVAPTMEFLVNVLGLRHTASINAPEVGPVIAFFRAHTLFHCFTLVAGPHNNLHHFQFTLKNAPAVHAAAKAMREGGNVDVVYGPVRHGPGHNIAYYFRDYAGNFVEYSAEEEIILDDDTYIVQQWSAENPMALDEWGSMPPEEFLA